MVTSSNGKLFRITGPLWGEFTVTGAFPSQRPVTRSFDVFFVLRLNKQLSKPSRHLWFQMPWCSLWRHCNGVFSLIHWGRVTHICVGKPTIIGSENGLSPGQRQAIIWTNDGILLIRTLGTNFSEILSEIHSFSFKKMHLKMPSGKWWPFCLSLNVLTYATV